MLWGCSDWLAGQSIIPPLWSGGLDACWCTWKAGKSVLKSSPVCRRGKSWNVQLYWRWGADVLVKNQERASAEQVTLFLTSQPHQKFFQVSFCVAKDDNGESISAWNEKKPPVCPRGERFHTRQPSLNFRHSSAPFCVRKRRLSTDFFPPFV